jgi:hypothetical protein
MAWLSSTTSNIDTEIGVGAPEAVKKELKLIVDKINEIIAKAAPGS